MSTPIPALGNKTPEQLKVTELRDELKKRGLNFKGLKKDLVERLDEVLREELARQKAEAETEAETSREDDKQPSDEEVNNPPPAESEEVFPVVEDEKVVSEPEPLQSAPTVVVEEEKAADVSELLQSAAQPAPLPISKSVEADLVTDHVPAEVTVKLGVELAAHPDISTTNSVPEVESGVVPQTIAHSNAVKDDRGAQLPQSPPQDVAEHVSDNDPVVAKGDDEATNEAAIVSGEEITERLQGDAQDVKEGQVYSEKGPEQENKFCQEVDQPHRKPSPLARQAASTEAVILEASDGEVEPEALPRENAPVSEVLDGEPDERRADEEGTYAEASREVVMETTVTKTVTVTTETTVEEVVYTETEAEVSRAPTGHDVGSPTERISDAGTRSLEVKDRVESGSEEAMDGEDSGTVKESNLMEIDSESLAGAKRKADGDDSRQQEPAKRQRRWNSEKNMGGAVADVTSPPNTLTTDIVKEMVLADSREAAVHAAAGSPSATVASAPKTSAPTNFEKPATSRAQLGRMDASVNGEAEKKRHVPPPLRTPTNSLKIDRFVRPFTIKAVRELLEQTGTVKDMWMDQIKTHCFVTYSSEEEAIATRNALYNLQWPVAGGKLLVAEFVEPEEVKLRVDGLADKPAATPVTTPRGSGGGVPGAAPVGLMAQSGPKPTSGLPPPPPLPPPPRERPMLPSKKEVEPPIPTLDDLFKKTWAKPQIYYLPLTEEQVAAKARNKPSGNKSSVKA